MMPDTDAVFSIDPARVPQKTLPTGAKMPALGLGTFGSDKYSPQQVAHAVRHAAHIGYRHFDCASVYGNEADVGRALQMVQQSGVKRADLWITSKVWNDRHDSVAASCEQSLKDLQVDYLDLFLVHWPFPNSHGKGVDGSSRDPYAVGRKIKRGKICGMWAGKLRRGKVGETKGGRRLGTKSRRSAPPRPWYNVPVYSRQCFI